jgi:plasmid stabilization system protein ParE
MALKVFWTKRAEKSFDKIIDYLIDNWSEKEVKNFVRKTFTMVNYISQKPRMFSYSIQLDIYSAVITKQPSLVYRIVDEKQIDLLFFWDNRRNPKKKGKGLFKKN